MGLFDSFSDIFRSTAGSTAGAAPFVGDTLRNRLGLREGSNTGPIPGVTGFEFQRVQPGSTALSRQAQGQGTIASPIRSGTTRGGLTRQGAAPSAPAGSRARIGQLSQQQFRPDPFAAQFTSPQGVTTISDLLGIAPQSGFEPPSGFPTFADVQAQNESRRAKNLPPLDFETVRLLNLLGPFGGQFFDPTRGITPKDAAFVETRFNLANLARADLDRQGADLLLNQLSNLIGQSPEARLSRSVATNRLQNPDVFTPQERDFLATDIKGRAARSFEEANEDLLADLASRGIAGGPTGRATAELRRDTSAQASDELRRLATELAVLDRQSEQQALAQLDALTARDEQRRLALGLERAELLVPTRGPISLAGVTAATAPPPSSSGLISGLIKNL